MAILRSRAVKYECEASPSAAWIAAHGFGHQSRRAVFGGDNLSLAAGSAPHSDAIFKAIADTIPGTGLARDPVRLRSAG